MGIPLYDEQGQTLDLLVMGLGWDAAPRWRGLVVERAEIDLDAVAVLYEGERPVDVVYHEALTSHDGTVQLLGDNVSGDGRRDDEVITINLPLVSPEITAVVLLVTCYSGQSLNEIENALCRLVDGVSGTEIVRYDLGTVPDSGMVVGVVTREGPGWEFRPVTTGIAARHPVEAVPQLAEYVR
jgi:tellurium resistance protein TerZ